MPNTVADIITNEKNRLDAKKMQVDNNLETQTRLMMLHDSQRKRTMRYTAIMAYLVFGVLVYFLFDYVASMFPVIPASVILLLKLIVIGSTVYLILTAYTDIATRSSGNFDEIDVPPVIDLSGNGVGLKLSETEGTPSNAGNFGQLFANQCLGETCCGAGTVWDPATLSCKPAGSAPAPGAVQSFTTMDEVQGVYLNAITSNLDGVRGEFVSSGEQYVRPELVNVSIGSIA